MTLLNVSLIKYIEVLNHNKHFLEVPNLVGDVHNMSYLSKEGMDTNNNDYSFN